LDHIARGHGKRGFFSEVEKDLYWIDADIYAEMLPLKQFNALMHELEEDLKMLDLRRTNLN